jgi:ABC-type Fe3+ transport system permease subunit
MTRSRQAITRVVAAIQLILIAPAALFMTMVAAQNLQPPGREPAHSAHGIVMWFAGRRWTLLVLLISLPLLVLALGCATLLRRWREDAELRGDALRTVAAIRAHLATLLIAAATSAAAIFLAIVAVHMLTD